MLSFHYFRKIHHSNLCKVTISTNKFPLPDFLGNLFEIKKDWIAHWKNATFFNRRKKTYSSWNNKSKWHLNTIPRSGQYLTHADSHITRAVAAMDSCFGLVRPRQHGIAVMRPNKAQTAVNDSHCLGDMALHMRKVLARWSVGVRVRHLLLLFLYYLARFLLSISPISSVWGVLRCLSLQTPEKR